MTHADPDQPHSTDGHEDLHGGPGGVDHGAHAGGHGHQAAESEPLGPIDFAAWAYALAGTALGLLVVAVLYVAAT